ncbi:MAG: hypothetical protein V1707_02980 [bacterium]
MLEILVLVNTIERENGADYEGNILIYLVGREFQLSLRYSVANALDPTVAQLVVYYQEREVICLRGYLGKERYGGLNTLECFLAEMIRQPINCGINKLMKLDDDLRLMYEKDVYKHPDEAVTLESESFRTYTFKHQDEELGVTALLVQLKKSLENGLVEEEPANDLINEEP